MQQCDKQCDALPRFLHQNIQLDSAQLLIYIYIIIGACVVILCAYMKVWLPSLNPQCG